MNFICDTRYPSGFPWRNNSLIFCPIIWWDVPEIRAIAQSKEQLLRESIEALTDFRNKIQDEYKVNALLNSSTYSFLHCVRFSLNLWKLYIIRATLGRLSVRGLPIPEPDTDPDTILFAKSEMLYVWKCDLVHTDINFLKLNTKKNIFTFPLSF